MNTPVEQPKCSYVGPNGITCPDVAGPSGLCRWHDPSVPKAGPEWARQLEAEARAGRSLAGFALARAELDGINLTFGDQREGIDIRGADLRYASLRGAHLYRADLSGSRLLKADLTGARLNEALLEDADLLGASFTGARIDGTNWGTEVRQEREARAARRAGDIQSALVKYKEAEEIYRDLRVTSEAQGHRRNAGDFFYREMLMRHFRLPRFSVDRWVSSFAHFIYGYGERPSYILAVALVYLAAMAAIYFVLGVAEGNRVIAFDPDAAWLDNLAAFGNCLYYSIITYTTVGYGDVTPLAATKPIAALEAMSGNFMMALFVVVFVRKLAR